MTNLLRHTLNSSASVACTDPKRSILQARQPTLRLIVALFSVAIAGSHSSLAQVLASAQSESVSVSAPTIVRPGQHVQFFVTIPASDVDGVTVSIPGGATISDVRVESYQAGSIAHSVEVEDQGRRAVIRMNQRLSASAVAEISFRSGELPSDGEIRVVPLVRQQGRLVSDESAVVIRRVATRQSAETTNRVLEMQHGKAVLELEERRLKNIHVTSPLTVATWVRTTDIGGVILSSWTGSEEDAYAFDLLVGVDGSAVFYRGQPGEHQSMRSAVPIADGTWHHLAITNDPIRNKTLLFVDGTAADSLLTPFDADARGIRLIVGGRVPTGGTATRSVSLFDGRVDDVGLWTQPLNRADVGELARGRSLNRRMVAAASAQSTNPEKAPQPLIYQRFLASDKEAGRLPSFIALPQDVVVDVEPVRHFSGRVSAGAVELQWASATPDVAEFLVQRSGADNKFETIATIESSALDGRYSYFDSFIDEQVLYYRVVQVMRDLSTTTSPVIKLGVADLLDTTRGLLLGNAPNPFSESTTINYELPDAGPVEISVWDLSGSPIRTLVDAEMPAGRHEVGFVSGDLPAGTYFVRIKYGDQLESAKMLLVK